MALAAQRKTQFRHHWGCPRLPFGDFEVALLKLIRKHNRQRGNFEFKGFRITISSRSGRWSLGDSETRRLSGSGPCIARWLSRSDFETRPHGLRNRTIQGDTPAARPRQATVECMGIHVKSWTHGRQLTRVSRIYARIPLHRDLGRTTTLRSASVVTIQFSEDDHCCGPGRVNKLQMVCYPPCREYPRPDCAWPSQTRRNQTVCGSVTPNAVLLPDAQLRRYRRPDHHCIDAARNTPWQHSRQTNSTIT